jgi:hypothetical protein
LSQIEINGNDIRDRLKQKGVIDTQDRDVPTLVPLHWTEAERGDAQRYTGTEVVQFHHKGGTFKAGGRDERCKVIVQGRNLHGLYQTILQHRIEWIEAVIGGRDFDDMKRPVVTSVEVVQEAVKG